MSDLNVIPRPLSPASLSELEVTAELRRADVKLMNITGRTVSALVVTSNDGVRGIISERDIVRAFSHYGEQVASMQVKDIMTHGLSPRSSGMILPS